MLISWYRILFDMYLIFIVFYGFNKLLLYRGFCSFVSCFFCLEFFVVEEGGFMFNFWWIVVVIREFIVFCEVGYGFYIMFIN